MRFSDSSWLVRPRTFTHTLEVVIGVEAHKSSISDAQKLPCKVPRRWDISSSAEIAEMGGLCGHEVIPLKAADVTI